MMICSKCGLDKTLLHKEQCEECLCDTVTEQAEQITVLQHEYDSTRGLWCIDKNPIDVDYGWICKNAFQLKEKDDA